MPRVDFTLWDRVYILKLICTAQMTYSSFITLVYFYLILIQSWTLRDGESERSDIFKFKWGVIGASILEFGLGILLAVAANMRGVSRRRNIIVWLILETFLIPISICLLIQLYYRIVNSAQQFTTYPHYSRANIAQVCLLLCQYIFIGYALDFLVHKERKPKMYDPSIRPESVYGPTDPQITTTESRHIRMSQSFLFQPSSSKRITRNDFSDEDSSSSSDSKTLKEELEFQSDRKTWPTDGKELREDEKVWIKEEDMVWSNKENTGQLESVEKTKENEGKNYEDLEGKENSERDDADGRQNQQQSIPVHQFN